MRLHTRFAITPSCDTPSRTALTPDVPSTGQLSQQEPLNLIVVMVKNYESILTVADTRNNFVIEGFTLRATFFF